MRRIIVNIINKLGLRPFAKRLIRNFNSQKKIEVNGKNFKTLRLYGSICKIEEPWMIELLKIVFTIRKGAFLDIGVNLGQTLIEVKSVDPERVYVGFEPNSSCVFYVEELIRINNFSNVKLIPVGLFNEEKILQLDLYDDNITNSGGSIIRDYWSYNNFVVQRSMLVPVFTFSKVKNSLNLPKFDVIKIDVEGAEYEVLQSLVDEMEQNKPIIFIEVLSAYSENNTIRFNRQKKLEILLKDSGYKVMRIIDNKERITRVEKIESFDVNVNPDHCNYIFYHIDHEKSIDEHFQKYTL